MVLGLFRRSAEPPSVREARERARERATASHQTDYHAMRTPPRPQDLALTALATAWLDELPAGVRPAALAAQYPRIVNRLALCWRDPALTRQVFDSLLLDRRERRRGFPAAVRDELLALRDFAARRTNHAAIEGLDVHEVDETAWRLRTRGIGDR